MKGQILRQLFHFPLCWVPPQRGDKMNLTELNKKYDEMQLKYGDPNLKSIFYGGCNEKPDICFVFMNPTGKNIASYPDWAGIRAPWIGTKNIWDLFVAIGKFDEGIYKEIKKRKPKDWTPEFANQVYSEITRNKIFLTNLGKCTQTDATLISNKIYFEYLVLLEREIEIIAPKVIVLFGNQVSTVFLNQNISVSQCRKKQFAKDIGGKAFKCFPVFYPVGNGRANIGKSIEDIKWIYENVLSTEGEKQC